MIPHHHRICADVLAAGDAGLQRSVGAVARHGSATVPFLPVDEVAVADELRVAAEWPRWIDVVSDETAAGELAVVAYFPFAHEDGEVFCNADGDALRSAARSVVVSEEGLNGWEGVGSVEIVFGDGVRGHRISPEPDQVVGVSDGTTSSREAIDLVDQVDNVGGFADTDEWLIIRIDVLRYPVGCQ